MAKQGNYVAGQGTGPDVAYALATKKSPDAITGREIVQRRSDEWSEHRIKWMWLGDSYEGGQRYRQADYGQDRKGLPIRNLFRHRREYPDPQQFPAVYQGFASASTALNISADSLAFGPFPGQVGAAPGATAQDDAYENRRARTPVPEFVSEANGIHLAKIFDQEIHRDGPDVLKDWWANVDGRGTTMDRYMKKTLGPILSVRAKVDVAIDRPRLPANATPPTNRAQEKELGLDRVVVSYILPENMMWWKADHGGNYTECLVGEWISIEDLPLPKEGLDASNVDQWRSDYRHFRHWSKTEWTLYNHDGSRIADQGKNPYGYIPIQPLIDQPLHRQPMVGKSRYEGIAELQRQYYNVDSELVLSNTLQALPLLSGPEDYCKADNTLSIGPDYILPKKKNSESGAYEGWEYVSPPKDPAESLQKKLDSIIDQKDRLACLAKPAGQTDGSTVSQSGLSKQMDANTGERVLNDLASVFADAERLMAERALMILMNVKELTPEMRESIKIRYPARFQLSSAGEMCDDGVKVQGIAGTAGAMPLLEGTLIKSISKAMLPGLDDSVYEQIDEEIDEMIATKSLLKQQSHELDSDAMSAQSEALAGQGSQEQGAGEDPTGQTGGTQVGNMTPNVV